MQDFGKMIAALVPVTFGDLFSSSNDPTSRQCRAIDYIDDSGLVSMQPDS